MIRELIANAVLHRTCVNAEASPITVAIYDDRLEITSPGKLKRGVMVEKMLEGVPTAETRLWHWRCPT